MQNQVNCSGHSFFRACCIIRLNCSFGRRRGGASSAPRLHTLFSKTPSPRDKDSRSFRFDCYLIVPDTDRAQVLLEKQMLITR